MTETVVNWTLEKLDDVVESIGEDYSLESGDPVTVKRVNRDNSAVFDGADDLDMNEPIHSRKEDLKAGVYIGATHADRDTSVLGTEYDFEVEEVIGITLEGLTSRGGNWGHVDPDGEDGVPFDTFRRRVQRRLLQTRTYPEAAIPNTEFYTLLTANDDPQSSDYRDFYRYSFDAILQGDETLP